MTAISHHAAPPPAAPVTTEAAHIQTPFGPISPEAVSVLHFAGGILGFPGLTDFALAPVPDPRLERFMVLQSLEDPAVSFIVLPMAEDGPIAAADRAEACAMLGSAQSDTAFLLVVTVRSDARGRAMTVNLRAPIAVDASHRRARQCVLSNNAYSVRHPL
ncbi:MAG: flagellar assembly protein FliW [Alphaproteobacteria bacterium]